MLTVAHLGDETEASLLRNLDFSKPQQNLEEGRGLVQSCQETMRSTVRLFNNGKVTVPHEIRETLGLEDGDIVEIEVHTVEEAIG